MGVVRDDVGVAWVELEGVGVQGAAMSVDVCSCGTEKQTIRSELISHIQACTLYMYNTTLYMYNTTLYMHVHERAHVKRMSRSQRSR